MLPPKPPKYNPMTGKLEFLSFQSKSHLECHTLIRANFYCLILKKVSGSVLSGLIAINWHVCVIWTDVMDRCHPDQDIAAL